jgi:hypothetical protein
MRYLSMLLILQACLPTMDDRQPSPAFYYWKTTFALSSTERRYLDSLDCRRLYVKFLDVGRGDETGGEIRPLALLRVRDTTGLGGRAVVPCVFLTNSVFAGITSGQLDWLAGRTALALRSVGRQFPDSIFTEYQFDCDWTPSTRAAYFSFLGKVRAALPPGARLSATIRLHQYKFPRETGVPPVDRGMLMFYNTGRVDDPGEENSIFEAAEAEKYIDGAPPRYALPLDVALPVFSWAVVFRDGDFYRLLPGVGPALLADTARFRALPARAGENGEVRRSTFERSLFLRPGDRLRFEGLSPAELRTAAGLAGRASLRGAFSVAFFELDTAAIRRFSRDDLQGALRDLE